MTLTWYGHSCFRLESPSGVVVFDPYAPNYVPGLALPELTADLVLCSHDHADHNAESAVALTGSEPECVTEQLCSWHDDEKGAKRGANIINIVTMEGIRVAHLGDQGCPLTPAQIRAIGHVNALLIPVGGYYTIDAPAARALADRIDAELVIPMHYRGEGFGFDVLGTVEDFAALSGDVERAGGPCVELRRGMPRKTVILELVK